MYVRYIRSVQLLSRVWLFATPWTAAHEASLSITDSQSLLKLMCIESVMPSHHLILCHLLLLLLSIFPSIRVFSSETILRIRWPKYWSFSFSSASVRYTEEQIYRESRKMGMGVGGEGNEASVFNKDRVPVWKRWWKISGGRWWRDCTTTSMYLMLLNCALKTAKIQQGPAVQHREPYSVFCDNLQVKRIWKWHRYKTESVCCTLETNATL